MRASRQLLAGAALAAFGVVLGLFVLEAGVRTLHLVPDRFWEPDPLLGSRLVPGREGWWTQEEHEFRVKSRINSDGRRDIDRPRDKPRGTVRILVLGDSFIEALHVPLEETFGRVLEAELADRAPPPIEVLSMGVSGYGTAGELLYYKERGRAYEPDLVLLAFYPGNDVRNNSPVLESVLPPVYDEDGTLLRVTAAKDGGRQRRRGMLDRSQAYRYFRKRLITGYPGLAARLVGLGLLGEGALRSAPVAGGVPVDYLVYGAETTPDWEDAWRHTFDLLGALRAAVESDGARLAVMIVTARELVYPETWEEILTANPIMRSLHWDLELAERRLERWCEANGVPCLRLSPSFLATAREGPHLHFPHDGHWTPAGHALAARTAARFLLDRELLPETKKKEP
jgi:hypothetical protein